MKAFRSDINGLRALAVMAVVLFHAGVPAMTGGFVGVDVFFVISGTLMTGIVLSGLDRGRFSVPGFWAARARRILPALFVLCLALAAGGWLFVEPLGYREIGLHVAAALTFFSNVQFWRESGYFDEAAGFKWLLHTWSLSVEWQFYIAYPLVMLGVWRLLGRRAVAPLLWVGFALSLLLSIVVTAWRPAMAFYMLPTRAWELLGGGLVCCHAPLLARLPAGARRGMEALGLAAILASVVFIDPHTPWPSFRALLPVGGAAAVIAADRGAASLLGGRVLQRLGLWSYSIYLWHWPVIVAARTFGWSGAWWSEPAAIALGTGLGALSFACVEQPSQGWLRDRPVPQVFGLAAAAAAALLLWSGLDLRHDGFVARARQPELFAAIEAARADWDFPEQLCARVGRDRSAHLCRIGAGSPEGTLVLGDSHANQWYPRAAARPGADVTFVTRDGCPPLPDLAVMAGADCPDYYRTALATAAAGHYHAVVLAAFWARYLGPEAFGDGACVTVREGCVPPDRPDAFEEVFADLARDLAPIAARSRVVIVLPDLVPPGDLPALLARHAFLGTRHPDLDARPAAAVRAEAATIRDALRRVAAEIGAVTVDPLDALCGPAECRFVDGDGRSLFRDSNHLRASVVRDGIAILDPYLDPPAPQRSADATICAAPAPCGTAPTVEASFALRPTLP